jgi:hypothetical protein
LAIVETKSARVLKCGAIIRSQHIKEYKSIPKHIKAYERIPQHSKSLISSSIAQHSQSEGLQFHKTFKTKKTKKYLAPVVGERQRVFCS